MTRLFIKCASEGRDFARRPAGPGRLFRRGMVIGDPDMTSGSPSGLGAGAYLPCAGRRPS